MSARQLNRLAKAKGLDPLLGGGLNVESEESDGLEDSADEGDKFGRAAVISASAFGEDSDESSSSSSSSEEEDGSDRDSDSDGDEHETSLGASSRGNKLGTSQKVTQHSSGGTEAPLPSISTSPPAAGHAAAAAAAATGTVVASLATRAKKKAAAADQQENEGDDDEYLNSIISEIALKEAAATAARGGAAAEELQTGAASPLALLLRCDPRCLKLDRELRRKFGGGGGGGGDRGNGGLAAGGGGGGGGGGRPRRTRRGMLASRGGNSLSASLTLKRLVVSAPKEDWPKPPSFVGGGLGMKKCEAGAPAYLPRWQLEAHRGAEWFVFERSSSLEQLQGKFEAVQRMHDPNYLASFVARAPYHAEALLQLGMVFAHTGQMDRASEFVGRSLYVLESAATEAFRPVDGACRLDVTLEINKTYFAAMFRHMQMSGMVGGARTALEVGRLLLSLDPLGDPMGCLLALDSYALTSRQGEFLLELHRSKLPIGLSPSGAAEILASVAYGKGVPNDRVDVTVQDLPGLSMSVCLAILDTTGDVMAAREAMASTLLRFPIMLEPLLEKCGVSPRSTSYPHDWKSVMQHPHFGRAQDRLPPGHVLFHLASIFARRGGELWKHERAEELLYDGAAGIALQGLATTNASPAGGLAGGGGGGLAGETAAPPAPAARAQAQAATADSSSAASEAEVFRRAYCSGSPIHKYLNLALSDFDESFALLPQDANVLDPRLMGPNFMNERVRLRVPPGAGGGAGGGGRGWGGGQDVLDEVLAMAMQVIGRQDAAARMRREAGGGGQGEEEGVLRGET
ncbi:unnamed protein product [Pylaiella littoralis]